MVKLLKIAQDNRKMLTSLGLSCCFSCKISNVTFIQYGIMGMNLIGKSYLHNIKFETMQFSQLHCQVVLLQYSLCPPWSNYTTYMHSVMINQLLIFNHKKCTTYNHRSSPGLYIKVEIFSISFNYTNKQFSFPYFRPNSI